MTHTHKHTSHARGGTKSDLNKRALARKRKHTSANPILSTSILVGKRVPPTTTRTNRNMGQVMPIHTHTHEIRDAQVRIVRKLHPLAVVARIHRNKHYVHQHGSCVLFKYAFPLKPKRATPQQKILLKQVDTSILLVCSLVSA